MATAALSTKAIGSTIKLNVNNALREFIVVHHGRPSSIYDNGWANATILLMKDVYEQRQWHTSNVNAYATSAVHSYLVNTFVKLFDSDVQKVLLELKIPYTSAGPNPTVTSGASGLPAKVFLLSGIESGYPASHSYVSTDGAKLDYFIEGDHTNVSALTRRTDGINGSSTRWWMRSASTHTDAHVLICNDTNIIGPVALSQGVRPAIALPSSTKIGDSGVPIFNEPPTTPETITVPAGIKGGSSITVSWSAATDPDGNLSGYTLQRCLDNGSWTQVYKGPSTSADDTVPFGTATVQYRVQAYDAENETSGYQTSDVRTVINNVAPVITGQDQDLGTKTEPFRYSYTVADEDGDNVTVTEVLESGGGARTLRTYTAQLGVENTLDLTDHWLYVQSGEATVTITASDGNGGTAKRILTFTRAISGIAASRAFSADAKVTRCMISLFPATQSTASEMVVQAANNPFDPNPVWEDVTAKVGKYVHVFENQTVQNGPGLGYRFKITPSTGGKVIFDSIHIRFE